MEKFDDIVIGSGAGGATTALTLVESGRRVLLLEEGAKFTIEDYGRGSAEAMQTLYRNRGMNPIMGSAPIGYVEGRCVGGSTEINTGFFHRVPPETILHWKSTYDLKDADMEQLIPHFEWAEHLLGVTRWSGPFPKSTQVFAHGIQSMGYTFQEVPRAAPGCRSTNRCASGCPTSAKKGMSITLLVKARQLGLQMLPNTRALSVLAKGGRISGVVAGIETDKRQIIYKTFKSDNVFVCCGPTESPALLQRSGIRRNIGNNLRIHPYLKLLSKYPEPIYSDSSPTPLLQVKEFWPEITIGGSYFTPGHMAVNLSDNWNGLQQLMDERQFMASFYVGVRGTNRGTVRNSSIDHKTIIKYDLSEQDLRNLSIGLARSACILLAGGAKAVYPSIAGFEQIKDPTDAIVWLEKILPANQLSLTTVHAFSTCPMGEKRDRCAVDSFGRVYGFQNLFVNDASILPDSPGVNPQGTVMAFARRNALRFLEEMRNQV